MMEEVDIINGDTPSNNTRGTTYFATSFIFSELLRHAATLAI